MTGESEFIRDLLDNKEKDKAFKKLLDLYQERLYWHIRKLVVTHENADDVLQNTFLRIYKSLPNFQQKSSLHTWMYRIAYNESLRFLEENKKKDHSSLDDVGNKYLNNLVDDAFFEGDEIQLKLQRILSKLPEKERQIFQMKYYDDLKFREMEEISGIKEGTLKSSYYNTVKYIEKNMLAVELITKDKV
ncbi:MAG: RNA polymerase subunit sigma-70 [Bacteroidetes bacterium HGW-Bacteroidetes-12]|nr:MAG: RNA polymerase subunit sigma-70 [Bacteroidetes bacterium HGW-Bacteroidetes-12]